MPQPRMDIRMIKDILRLKYQGGLSHERIARSLSISKGAVAKYLSLASGAGLDWASTAELDEASLERRLMGGGAALSRAVETGFRPRNSFAARIPRFSLPFQALLRAVGPPCGTYGRTSSHSTRRAR